MAKKVIKDIASETRCTICENYGFAVVDKENKCVDRLCGDCISNKFGRYKKEQQTKLLL